MNVLLLYFPLSTRAIRCLTTSPTTSELRTPPDVWATVPERVLEDKVRRFVLSRLAWVRRQREEFAEIPRKEELQFTSGETVFMWGRAYRLQVEETSGKHCVMTQGDRLHLLVQSETDRAGRRRALYRHYQEEIAGHIPHLRERWEEITGLSAREYRIKFMRTKWGNCTVADRRVWLNLKRYLPNPCFRPALGPALRFPPH